VVDLDQPKFSLVPILPGSVTVQVLYGRFRTTTKPVQNLRGLASKFGRDRPGARVAGSPPSLLRPDPLKEGGGYGRIESILKIQNSGESRPDERRSRQRWIQPHPAWTESRLSESSAGCRAYVPPGRSVCLYKMDKVVQKRARIQGSWSFVSLDSRPKGSL